MIQLLLLIVIQLAPAVELSCDNIAFAFGADRLLSGSAAAEGSATIYSRAGMPDISGLRAGDDGIDASLSPRTAGTMTTSTATLCAAVASDAAFPHRRNDILHVSPKHSPPFRS